MWWHMAGCYGVYGCPWGCMFLFFVLLLGRKICCRFFIMHGFKSIVYACSEDFLVGFHVEDTFNTVGIATLVVGVMMMRGATWHPKLWTSSRRGLYLVFLSIHLSGLLQLQYVNCRNGIMLFPIGCVGGGALCGWLVTSSIP